MKSRLLQPLVKHLSKTPSIAHKIHTRFFLTFPLHVQQVAHSQPLKTSRSSILSPCFRSFAILFSRRMWLLFYRLLQFGFSTGSFYGFIFNTQATGRLTHSHSSNLWPVVIYLYIWFKYITHNNTDFQWQIKQILYL